MSELLHEMLAFVLQNDAGLKSARARTIASFFGSVEDFLGCSPKDIKDIRGIGKSRAIQLTDDEVVRIMKVKDSGVVALGETVAQNFLAAVSRDFTRKQLTMIRSMTLDRLNPNPFLITSLNMFTPDEVMRLNVYAFASRSIVTSMGFFVEKLMLSSSDTVEKAPKKSGWDLVKVDSTGHKHWIQAKSGPNDMDKDQLVYWSQKIQEKLIAGDSAYIGITYGKRTNETVSIGLMKQLLSDWELEALIGRELWDFLSDDPDYHATLFDVLRQSAQQVLGSECICDEIEASVEKLKAEFISKYGDGEQGVRNYIAEIF